MRAAANNDLGLKIFGGDALADTMMVNLLQDQPDALKDLSVTTVNKGKNPFIKKYRAAFPAVTYGSFAAQAYDAMVALLRAYAAAKPPRGGSELAKELRKQKFEGEWIRLTRHMYAHLSHEVNTATHQTCSSPTAPHTLEQPGAAP